MSPLIRALTGWRRRSRWHVAGTVIATLAMAVACLSAATFSAGTASAASCGTTNLALHQPTTASSVHGPSWLASNATDGSLTTRWSSAFSDPQWLQVDLGTPQPVCRSRRGGQNRGAEGRPVRGAHRVQSGCKQDSQ